jgi:hypothetical protein
VPVRFAVPFYSLTTREPLSGYSAISSWSLTSGARVQFQASPREICDGQNGTEKDFSPSNWPYAVSVVPPVHYTYSANTDVR